METKIKETKTLKKGGEKMMKTIFKLVMVALLCSVFAGTASAEILNSKHDFSDDSTEGTYASGSESRMCVFCHTPHNAVENVPLWNRSSAAGAVYRLYTASATLTSATKVSVITNANISYKCLSCHDGAITIGGGVVQFKGNANTGNATNSISGLTQISNGASGLTDDHPIGFDFQRAGNAVADPNIKGIATVTGAGFGLKFYNAGGKQNQMECATCHDVHGQAAPGTKFLRTFTTGSYLCLTCHIK